MADAPSSSTSTRSMAADGMLFRSTPLSSPGDAKLAMRRPFSSTSVEDVPRPRRLAELKPIWSLKPPVPMLTPSVRLLADAEMVAISSAAVVTPALSMSPRVMTCTGSAASASMRLMAEPVISTRWEVCASAEACRASKTAWAQAPRRKGCARRRVMGAFRKGLDVGDAASLGSDAPAPLTE
jgi:hypothetical protein